LAQQAIGPFIPDQPTFITPRRPLPIAPNQIGVIFFFLEENDATRSDQAASFSSKEPMPSIDQRQAERQQSSGYAAGHGEHPCNATSAARRGSASGGATAHHAGSTC